MSSFGHVRDMMERYAANRELMKAKRNRHFRRTKLYDRTRFEERNTDLKQLDKEEWERVKKRIRAEKKRTVRLWVITSVVAVVMAIWVIDYLISR